MLYVFNRRYVLKIKDSY